MRITIDKQKNNARLLNNKYVHLEVWHYFFCGKCSL